MPGAGRGRGGATPAGRPASPMRLQQSDSLGVIAGGGSSAMIAPPHRRFTAMKRIVATFGILMALALPAGALADTTGGGADVPPAGSTGGMTVQLRSVHLTTRAVAQVEVAFSCQPKP